MASDKPCNYPGFLLTKPVTRAIICVILIDREIWIALPIEKKIRIKGNIGAFDAGGPFPGILCAGLLWKNPERETALYSHSRMGESRTLRRNFPVLFLSVLEKNPGGPEGVPVQNPFLPKQIEWVRDNISTNFSAV